MVSRAAPPGGVAQARGCWVSALGQARVVSVFEGRVVVMTARLR